MAEATVEPRRLSDFLRDHRDEILAHWEQEVRKVRAARTLERPVLLDHLPQFIEELADYVDDLRVGTAAEPPEEHPRIHALERLEVGYDLAEVVEEYSVLRSSITELAARLHTPALRSIELPRLHQAIDKAIATSVVHYTAARERTLRALDRISSAALVHHDVESLLPRTLDAFLGTTASVDTVALALIDDGSLTVRAAVGFPPPGPIGQKMARDGFCEEVWRSAQPVFVPDAAFDARLRESAVCAPGTHALFGVPLTMGHDCLGVAVMGSRSSREFSREDQFLFRTMVHRVAALFAQARLDAEVRRRAAELEAVIESIPEAVYVGDASGIKRANRAALDMLGYGSIAELNKSVATLANEIQTRRLDGSPIPVEEQVFTHALSGENAASEVLVRHRGSGRDVVVRSSAAPIRLGQEIVGAVAVHTDITARIHEEDELRAALVFRDRMLGVLSHDVRNPLSVILTSTGMLLRRTRDDQEQVVLERVAGNARRIERLVRDLVDYTRTRQGGSLPVSPRETDLLAVCRQVVEGTQVLYPNRPLQLTSEGGTIARADPDRATQVVSNLLTNALKYGAAGTPVRISLRATDGVVVLAVHNEGSPISPEMLPRLFDAFQRGPQAEDGNADGLGLGLFIVQQIVAAHGGSVDVTSREGDGTTFTVRWPR